MSPECHGNGVARHCDLWQERNVVQISLHISNTVGLCLHFTTMFCSFLQYLLVSMVVVVNKGCICDVVLGFCH